MVRLKEDRAPSMAYFHSNFNSYMVRLKVVKRIPGNYYSTGFQFLYGAIKRFAPARPE